MMYLSPKTLRSKYGIKRPFKISQNDDIKPVRYIALSAMKDPRQFIKDLRMHAKKGGKNKALFSHIHIEIDQSQWYLKRDEALLKYVHKIFPIHHLSIEGPDWNCKKTYHHTSLRTLFNHLHRLKVHLISFHLNSYHLGRKEFITLMKCIQNQRLQDFSLSSFLPSEVDVDGEPYNSIKKMNDETLTHLCSNLPCLVGLKKFKLSNTPLSSEQFNRLMKSLIPLQRITTLCLSDYSLNIGEGTIEAFLNCLNRLQALRNLTLIQSCIADSLSRISQEIRQKLWLGLPNHLEALKLPNFPLEPVDLEILARKRFHFKTLDLALHRCDSLKPQFLLNFLRSFDLLQNLRFTHYKLSKRDLSELSSFFGQLHSLDLSTDLSNQDVPELLRGLEKKESTLTHLTLKGLNLSELPDLSKHLKNGRFPLLRILNLKNNLFLEPKEILPLFEALLETQVTEIYLNWKELLAEQCGNCPEDQNMSFQMISDIAERILQNKHLQVVGKNFLKVLTTTERFCASQHRSQSEQSPEHGVLPIKELSAKLAGYVDHGYDVSDKPPIFYGRFFYPQKKRKENTVATNIDMKP